MIEGGSFRFQVNSDVIHFSSIKSPSNGDLLIASANMVDPNFRHSVIFLCEHSEDGSFGLVLNRLLSVTLTSVITDLDGWDAPLYQGGPVQTNTLHFLHCRGDLPLDSKEIKPGLYWGGSFDKLLQLIEKDLINPAEFRFFAGYAGWNAGQLDDEMEQNSWYVLPADRDTLFASDTKTLWPEAVKRIGTNFEMLINFPEDPSCN